MVFTSRFLFLMALGIVPMLLSALYPPFAALGLLWNLLVLAVLVPDYLSCPRPETVFSVERTTEEVLSVAASNTVTVRVRNLTSSVRKAMLRDEPPADFVLTEESKRQWTVRLNGFQQIDILYQLQPPTRGDFVFGDIAVRLLSPLGLLWRSGTIEAKRTVSVYPNLHAVAEYDLLLRRAHLTRQGVRRVRVAGGGREFAALREYTPDDEFRTIDWKATARRGKVISRTFEAERSQDILLLIDLGRLMRQEIAKTQKLDHVVNAALMLSHVVAGAEDRIGLLTFADERRAWVPPRRGRAAAQEILNALYSARALPVESDYRAAFRFLATRWRKRSLAVLFTDLADPDSSAVLLAEIAQLAARHLVVCVTVADPLIGQRARQRPEEPAQVYEKAVAAEVLADRRRALNLLKKRGVLVVDAEPQELSADLVARYLEVKARSLI